MLRINYNKDYKYAATRLTGTVIVAAGRPVYVTAVCTKSGNVIGDDTINQQRLEVPLDKIDLTPTKVGYVDGSTIASFALRTPSRFYKQGLHARNLKFISGKPYYNTSRNIGRTLIGLYKNPLDVFESLVNGEAVSRGISHDLALHSAGEETAALHYRTKKVGVCSHTANSKGLNFDLDKDYFYLEELVGEVLDVSH